MQTKHGKIHHVLRDEILGGKYESSALPSEVSLVRRFGVSRITVQRALRDLEREGMIRKIPRRGAFVVPAQQRTQTIAMMFPAAVSESDAAFILRAAGEAAARRGFSVLRIEKGE